MSASHSFDLATDGPRSRCAAGMSRWIVVCAVGAFLTALPTAVWRILPGLGIPLGTPVEWREFQQLPGIGTWYVLGLSMGQIIAAGCCLVLATEVRRLIPARAPVWAAHLAPRLVGVAGLVGAGVLAVLVVMSIIAWDTVDPFAGHDYDGWAWLSLVCYLVAALWPALLTAASIGYLVRRGRP